MSTFTNSTCWASSLSRQRVSCTLFIARVKDYRFFLAGVVVYALRVVLELGVLLWFGNVQGWADLRRIAIWHHAIMFEGAPRCPPGTESQIMPIYQLSGRAAMVRLLRLESLRWPAQCVGQSQVPYEVGRPTA